MGRVTSVACAVAVSGCFNPTFRDVRCGPAGECPPDLVCDTTMQRCVQHLAGDAGVDGTLEDAPTDAPTKCDPLAIFGTPTALQSGLPGDPVLTADERIIFGTVGTDIGMATRMMPTDTFGPTQSAIGSAFNDYQAAITPEGLEMYFHGDVTSSDSDIFRSQRPSTTANFGPAVSTNLGLNSGSTKDIEPFITSSGIYFSTTPTGGAQFDLAYAPRNGTGFGTRIPLTPLNTGNRETDPVVSSDELAIYFTSDRAGSNGFDIWRSTRQSLSGAWSMPVRVAELSSAGSDKPSYLSTDNCRLYIQRSTGIFMATRTP